MSAELQALLAVLGGQHLVALEPEVVGQAFEQPFFVFDDQHSLHGVLRLRSAVRRPRLRVLARSRARAAGLGPRRGQHQRERAALARAALDLDAPAVRAHDLIHQRQPEPGALHVVHQPGLDAHELLEDALLIRRRDADAAVRHRDRHRAVARPGRDPHLALRRREYLIALSSRLSTQCGSAAASPRTGGRSSGRSSLEPEPLVLEPRPEALDRLRAPRRARSTGSKPEDALAGLEPREVEDVVHQLLQPHGLAPDACAGTSRSPPGSRTRRISSVSTASRISAIGVLSSWVTFETKLDLSWASSSCRTV